MYFKNRAEAGRMLAKELKKYKKKEVAIVSLSEGGVIVGAQIAMELHASLMVVLTESIYLPGEIEAVAGLNSAGGFAYNGLLPPGELEEATSEFHNYIDQKRFESMHHLNIMVGQEGEIHKQYLRHKIVVLVSDGLASGFSLDVANDYLKTVNIKRLIIATPFASVNAVDRMHLLADEIQCLSVIPNFYFVNHYYDDNTVPKMEDLFSVISNIATHWHH